MSSAPAARLPLDEHTFLSALQSCYAAQVAFFWGPCMQLSLISLIEAGG